MDALSNIGSRNCYGDVYAEGQAQVILGNVYQQAPAAELTKEQRCHQVFKTSSYENHKDRNPPRVAGTCRWALDNQQFLDWRDSSQSSLLWISADPGCGKSVLSRALVDEELPAGSRPSNVCYFFFKDNEEQDNLETALCALLHQLFSQQPHLIHHAIPAWERDGDSLRRETREMWRILRASAADSNAYPIVCVLDALDECKDVDRRQLIDLLCDAEHTTRLSPSTGILKMLATSRPYDNVQRWFEQTVSKWPQIRLRGEDENDQIHQEINLVIEQRLQDLTGEFDLSPTDSGRLREQLLHMQHRTYLWLHLAMEEVRETCQDSIYGGELRIMPLPTSVEDAYERILRKIKDRQRTMARRILLIIVGARRPLSITEMAKALGAARASEQNQSCLSRIEPTRLEKQIREQCGLFVFINHSQLFLIHQTAKEFLVAQSANMDTSAHRWKSCLLETQVEDEMAITCMTYLSLYDKEYPRSEPDFNSGADSQVLEKTDSFFRYCAEHWTSHLRDEFVQSSDDLLSKVLTFHARGSDLFHAWFPIMWRAMFGYWEVPTLGPQHSIAITGHSFVLQKILDNDGERNVLLNAKDSTGSTALHWAAELGHRGVVQLLCDRGANLNTKDAYHKTALNLASHRGYTELVQILLDGGADVNNDSYYDDPDLLEVSSLGYKDIAQLLIKAGANINARDTNGSTALTLAAGKGYKEIVQILLDAGADLDAICIHRKTALIEASIGGFEEIVQILIDAGADVNASSERGWTALMQASEKGYDKVAQILLDSGASVDDDFEGWTPLMLAAVPGHEKIVQMLLDAGADVNASKPNGRPTLLEAAAAGYEKVVDMLINSGPHVDVPFSFTLLMWASFNAQGNMVRILLDTGASVNTSCSNIEGYTALMCASKTGHEKVIQILLDAGAKVNAIGTKDGRTALLEATLAGHAKVVQILLDSGANIDDSKDGFTLLIWVSREGDEGLVQTLLNAGADVNAGNAFGNTALMWASRQVRMEVVQILLDSGADIHAEFLGQTALLMAEAEGRKEVVEFQLKHGSVDVR